MKQTIGETISRLRREQNRTQGQLAAAVGVSSPAVSKWETGQSCPDIMLLPALARYFGCTIDALLSFAPTLTEEQAQQHADASVAIFARDGFGAGLQHCTALVHEYPDSAILRIALHGTLTRCMPMANGDVERNEAKACMERWLTDVLHAPDALHALTARYLLGFLYMSQQRLDDADRMLSDMPNSTFDASELMPSLRMLQGRYTEAAKLAQQNLLSAASTAITSLQTLSQITVCETGDMAHAHACLAAAETILSALSLQPLAFSLASTQLSLSLKSDDIDTQQATLERYVDTLLDPGTVPDSPFFSLLTGADKLENKAPTDALHALVADTLDTNPAYEHLRAFDWFQAAIKRLQKHDHGD